LSPLITEGMPDEMLIGERTDEELDAAFKRACDECGITIDGAEEMRRLEEDEAALRSCLVKASEFLGLTPRGRQRVLGGLD